MTDETPPRRLRSVEREDVLDPGTIEYVDVELLSPEQAPTWAFLVVLAFGGLCLGFGWELGRALYDRVASLA